MNPPTRTVGGVPLALLLLLLLLLLVPFTTAAAEGWQRVPLVTRAALDDGVRFGGEGCQWPYDVAFDETDGSLAIFATDVGGMWRSLDGGTTWEPCNVGHTPRGSSAVSIDPNFPTRVLSDGMNSMGSAVNGLYLSEDAAASWEPVLRAKLSNFRDRRQKFAWDASTRDDAAGLTRVVYWSRTEEFNRENWGDFEYLPGLYRSEDGGRAWTRLNDEASAIAGHSQLAVDPGSGRLYAGNDRGLFASDDRGERFNRVLDEPCTGVTTSPARPGTVWLTTVDGVMRSLDGGETFEALSGRGLEEPLRGPDGEPAATPREDVAFAGVEVSRADPDRLAVRSTAKDWRFARHVSHDGGKTWTTSAVEPGHAFMPQNAREALFAWHPTDPDRVLSVGGDWPTASDDGGKTFRWSGDGQNAIYIATKIAFNPHHPGLLFLPSQDYNGAVTHDGGKSWSYTDVSGLEWGGFAYGGVAITPEVILAGLAGHGWSTPRVLQRSRDGGKTWAEVPGGPAWKSDPASPDYGYDDGFMHPTDPAIAFVGPLRTGDGGETWTRMDGCSGVLAGDASGTLYGGRRHLDSAETDVVRSRDGGETWEVLMKLPGTLDDLAATPDGGTLFLAHRDRLWKILPDADRSTVLGNPLLLLSTPPTGTGLHRIKAVAVDPRDPGRVFAGQRVDLHTADVGVMRSTDGGATWENLNRTEPLGTDGGLDGGREPQSLRVDPHTGDLWVTTGCFGVWRYRSTRP